MGPLQLDPANLLDLPKGFSYQIISRQGTKMDDGLLVPDKPDGMATFAGPEGLTLLVRNHEIDPSQIGPFGPEAKLLELIDPALLYDLGEPGRPCIGGTTTIVFDTRRQKVVREFLSLAGTIRNCAGGPTPWGSWITCEEASDRPGVNVIEGDNGNYEVVCEKYHGYNFEVPATSNQVLHKAVPLKAMGRFRHEAVAVEPRTSIVYQTEDVEDGLIYRFLPNHPGQLSAGGKLQALCLKQRPSADTRNWTDTFAVPVGKSYQVQWIDLEDVEAPENDLRLRGFSAGAARFARGEGMWYSAGEIYFACTNGGAPQLGQLWKYTPSPYEGEANEADQPGKLELFVEPTSSQMVVNADNLTGSPWGDLIVCEDRSGEEVRLVGVTPEGQCYTFAHNHAHTEFSGATFSPDGTTLFVNLQHQGLTLAITGPWPH